ncbi:MAG: extracellular matrix/biofilm biosynthesis regulator RemA family protein [Thermomicrobiales bacterium]
MATELIHIGFGHLVAMNRVVAIVAPESAPLKRVMKEARDQGTLIDATSGRRTKSLLYLDNGMVLAAALGPETIAGRLGGWRQGRVSMDEPDDEPARLIESAASSGQREAGSA